MNYRIVDYKTICYRIGLDDSIEIFNKTIEYYLSLGWELHGELHETSSGKFMCQSIILKEVIDTN